MILARCWSKLRASWQVRIYLSANSIGGKGRNTKVTAVYASASLVMIVAYVWLRSKCGIRVSRSRRVVA